MFGDTRPIDRATAAALALLVLGTAVPALAQGAIEPLRWQRGPATAALGQNLAEIDLGSGYVFLDKAESQRFMEMTQNPVSGIEVGTVAPISEEEQWFVIFEFEEVGYVDDSEKDDLDPAAMLEAVREGTEAANVERRERGWDTMSILGWHEEPHYDERTNNLSWAIVGESGGQKNVNRIVKLLGRRGVMTATLVASPEELDAAIAEVDVLLGGYRYRPGSTYAEYVPGSDKLATYGLTALVVGGGAAALLKSGLLAKIWKPLLVALVGVGAAIKRLFFSGRSSDHPTDQPIA